MLEKNAWDFAGPQRSIWLRLTSNGLSWKRRPALLQYESRRVRIGELAQAKGFLTPQQVQDVLFDQERQGRRFGETAMALGLLNEETVALLLAYQQEDPIQLASVMVRLEILPQQRAVECLQEYLAGNQQLAMA